MIRELVIPTHKFLDQMGSLVSVVTVSLKIYPLLTNIANSVGVNTPVLNNIVIANAEDRK